MLLIPVLLLLLTQVIADVSISKPLTGASYAVSGGTVSVEISWIESNANPLLGDIESYTFVLCSGPNTDIDPVETIAKVSASDISDYTYTASIDASIGASGSYYIQVYAQVAKGFTIHYTSRFSLTGMTGSYKPTDGGSTTPPSAQTSLADDGAAAATSIDTRSFTLQYSQQTGATRYAPMQTQPGTKVTANKSSWTRRYPTSSVSYFSTVRNDLLAQSSTITQGWSYIISSAINWATPAPYPSANGGWYNPSQKVKAATISTPSILQKATSSSIAPSST